MQAWCRLAGSLAEKCLEILVNSNMNQQCALAAKKNKNKKAKSLLDHIRKSVTSRSRKIILPFYSALDHF